MLLNNWGDPAKDVQVLGAGKAGDESIRSPRWEDTQEGWEEAWLGASLFLLGVAGPAATATVLGPI